VLDLYKLPCLVTQFATTDTANHFAEVFRNLAEADLPKVLEGIVSAVKEAMLDIPALEWHDVGVDTVASTRMLHPGSPDDLEKADAEFRKIVHLNNVLGLLSSLYSTIGFTHGKVATTFLMALGAFDGTPFIANLGTLHRASIWQNIWLKAKQSPTLVKPHAITQLQTFEETILSPSVEFSASELENTASSTPVPAPSKAESNQNDASAQSGTSTIAQKPLPENYISLQYLFTRIPLQLTSFFQGVVKMLLFRRVEPVHKVQAVPTANCLADMLVEHLKLHNESAPSAIEVASKAAIMSLVSLLLFDGWTTTLSVNTMLLVAFERKGGIAAIKRLLVQHVDSLGTEPLKQSSRFQQDKAGLLRLLASLKVTFDLVKTLVSASPLCESSQTAILTTKDKEPDHEEYFSPYEFLIKLRLELADPIWKAFTSVWLVECPITFVKTITKSALTLVEPVPSPTAAPGSAPLTSSSNTLSSTLAGLGFPTSRAGATVSASEVRPDPYYADMLVEMGFSRYAANLSLQRTNNVLPSATHYIVQHGHQLVAPGGAMSVDETSSTSVSGNFEISDIAQSDGAISSPVTAASASPGSRAKAIAEGRKCHLEQRRKIYRQGLPTRALQIVEVHNDLVFDFAHTLLENPASIAAITDAISEVDNVDPLRDAKLQARLRLFVVVAHQPAFGANLNVDKCTELMETLRKLISSLVSPRPAWVPALLLAVDCLLMWGEGVKPMVDGEPQTDIVAGPRYESARAEILSFATSLLAQPDLHEHELLAILRTLVFLTRDRSLLQPFLEKTGLPGLFQAVLATSTKRRHTAMALATIICRHLIEDEAVLQRCMEREIQQWFARPPRNSSTATIKLFVSNLRSAVLRDPSAFLKVAANELKLAEAEPRGGMHHVALKDKEPSPNEIAAVEAEVTTVAQPIDSDQMQIDDPFQAMPETIGTAGSPLEQVMGYLINEIFSIHKTQIAKPAEAETKADVKQSPENQLSAILLVMTELLGSYNESKISMLQPSKKMGKEAVGGNKMRSPVLQILLNHYVCNIVFDADVTRSSGDKVTDSQKARMNISNWAGAVIVALCSDASGPGALKNAPSSIVSIRKTVMDTVAKAIKEVGTATDPLNLRYGRLWALSELCYRLLTARSSVQPRHHDDSSLHIAKIMLEKGFVPLLTNAMAEVDLTYPQVKNLITAIVQPLEYL
jgi:E3 ubiquitin-protein ligase HUWE1